jgi:hypothetical protein
MVPTDEIAAKGRCLKATGSTLELGAAFAVATIPPLLSVACRNSKVPIPEQPAQWDAQHHWISGASEVVSRLRESCNSQFPAVPKRTITDVGRMDWQGSGRRHALIRDVQCHEPTIRKVRGDDVRWHFAPPETGHQKIEPASEIDKSPSPASDNAVVRARCAHRVRLNKLHVRDEVGAIGSATKLYEFVSRSCDRNEPGVHERIVHEVVGPDGSSRQKASEVVPSRKRRSDPPTLSGENETGRFGTCSAEGAGSQ